MRGVPNFLAQLEDEHVQQPFLCMQPITHYRQPYKHHRSLRNRHVSITTYVMKQYDHPLPQEHLVAFCGLALFYGLVAQCTQHQECMLKFTTSTETRRNKKASDSSEPHPFPIVLLVQIIKLYFSF